jgi:hypothetical protein
MAGDDDFVPPRRVFGDDIPVLDPELGTVPFWKSLIWNTANLRNSMAMADSAEHPLHDEDLPLPRVGTSGSAVARKDEVPGSGGEAERAAQEEKLAAVMASLDRLSARMDEMERQQAEVARNEAAREKAQQALLAAEEKAERVVATREAIDAVAAERWRRSEHGNSLGGLAARSWPSCAEATTAMASRSASISTR